MSSRGRGIPAPWRRSSAAVSTVVTDHGAWAARPHMDDTFRRQWAIQLAREQAEQARIPSSFEDEVAEPSSGRSSARGGWGCRSARCWRSSPWPRKGFVRAATRLGYSRSTISHQIAQLEAAIGVSLVVRGSGSRSVTVTPAGRVVVAHGAPCSASRERRESSSSGWHAGLGGGRPPRRSGNPVAAPSRGLILASPARLKPDRSSTVPRPDRGVSQTSKLSTFPGNRVAARVNTMRRQTSGDPACGMTPGPDPDPEDGTAMSTSQSDETGL